MSKFRHLKSKLNEKAERLAKLEAVQLADEVEMDLGIGWFFGDFFIIMECCMVYFGWAVLFFWINGMNPNAICVNQSVVLKLTLIT
nr:hypothetical protein [Providencia sp. PROV257]